MKKEPARGEGDEDSAPPRGVSWKPLRRAKTESLRRRFSRLAPRRYHTLCEKFFTRRPFCRQRLPTIQSSTFDLLLHIRDRSNIYPRPEERLDEGCGGEKGGLRLYSGGGLFADKDTSRGYTTERVDKQGF